jgi:hypothetical protein
MSPGQKSCEKSRILTTTSETDTVVVMAREKIVALMSDKTQIFYVIDGELSFMRKNTDLIDNNTGLTGRNRHVGGSSH